MKLQNLTVIFIIIILPIILITSLYISTGIKTIKYQALYDTALLNATHDAIYAFEQNTANNKYSDNAETKRSIIKSSVKMFETSLANAAGISAYSSDEIEEYIPAIVFGMYDGFYMYAPSYNTQSGKYEHELKNYVYYSETLDDGTIIRYSLDNYLSVTVEKASGEYEIKEGYLIDLDDLTISGDTVTYKGLTIQDETINGVSNSDAKNYYKQAEAFTEWFLGNGADDANITKPTYLQIGDANDPEDENSAFVQHKRTIIKEKMESVLNSTITAYSNRTWGQNYKMPKLSEEDWEKIYNNISVTTFFQGKRIGLTKYNGYCVLNSTNSSEYVNPNLMYFIDNTGYYHDIRCTQCGDTLTGYKIGSFGNKKVTDSDGNVFYQYEHNELACYSCINGNIDTSKSVYNYIGSLSDTNVKKIAYWTSLARERYNTIKLTTLNTDTTIKVFFETDGGSEIAPQTIIVGGKATRPADPTKGPGYTFAGWYTDTTYNTVFNFNNPITSNTTVYAKWDNVSYIVTFDTQEGSSISPQTVNYGEKATRPANPTKTGCTFAGWYTDTTYSTEFDFNNTITSNTTVYAKWNIVSYTVTFNTQGGSSVDSQTVNYGEKATRPADPTKGASYTFAGWYKNLTDTEQYDFDTPVTTNITLHAKWNNVSYVVTFNTQGGSRIASQTVNYGEKATRPANPIRAGYTFAGWYTSTTYSTEFEFNDTITSSTTVYAKWIFNVPTIEDVYYDSSTKTIYAKIKNTSNISSVKIERKGTFTYNRDMDFGNYSINSKQYNYKYKFTLNPSGDSYTITVTDTSNRTYTNSGTIP